MWHQDLDEITPTPPFSLCVSEIRESVPEGVCYLACHIVFVRITSTVSSITTPATTHQVLSTWY